MIVLFLVLYFILSLIIQQYICGMSWQDYVYIGGIFRGDLSSDIFCGPAKWHGPKGAELKSFALYI